MIAARRTGRPSDRGGSERGREAEARAPAAARRGPGRPARLSRELVVDAVLAMLEREPDEALTIARIAREVEAAPAALYRHFDSLDDLLDGVLARVLETSESGLETRASWEEQLATWMHELRAHLLHYPSVIRLIGRTGRTSPAWLETSSTLVEILAGAGLEGHELAMTYLWILETTCGLLIQESLMPVPEQLANARAAHAELSDRARARFSPIVSEMSRIDGDALFAFGVEQVTSWVSLRREASPDR